MTEKDIFADYRKAREIYDAACKNTSQARSVECDALNRLNAAQKAIRAHMDELVKDAPRDSDWKRQLTPGQPV